jgi:hypothetical protein
MKSIKDFVNKKGCGGIHTLSYGSLGEHQAEMMIQEQVEEQEENKLEQSEHENKEVVKENTALLVKEK